MGRLPTLRSDTLAQFRHNQRNCWYYLEILHICDDRLKFFLATAIAGIYFFHMADSSTEYPAFFTDQQVTAACDLHLDNLRKLITWRAVIPIVGGGGRGKTRKWSLMRANRITVIATIFNAGFSLRMAHTITYCAPLDRLFFALNPSALTGGAIKKEGWLDPDNSKIRVNPQDWYLDIANGQFVYVRGPDLLWCIGRIGDHGTRFISNEPVHAAYSKDRVTPEHWEDYPQAFQTLQKRNLAKWENPFSPEDRINPDSLAYSYDPDLDHELAERAHANPRSLTTINISLSVRIALRKLLQLPVEYP